MQPEPTLGHDGGVGSGLDTLGHNGGASSGLNTVSHDGGGGSGLDTLGHDSGADSDLDSLLSSVYDVPLAQAWLVREPDGNTEPQGKLIVLSAKWQQGI